jgi:hypothetical protein
MLGPHLLGRIQPPDFEHVALHPFAAPAPPAWGVEVSLRPPTLSSYDQGQTPKCVAYSSSRVINWFNQYAFDADWLYDECKKIDPWPGEDGTSARYACDVLRRKGHWRTISGKPVKAGAKLAHGISGNTWAQSVDDIRSVFARSATSVFARGKPQPVLVGSDWFEAWFTPQRLGADPDYYLRSVAAAGNLAGGHEWGIWSCSDKREAFGIRNTWGKAWPALVWIHYSDITELFNRGADCCVLNDLATR